MKREDKEPQRLSQSRRDFLVRNLLGAGAVASSVVLGRIERARAQSGGDDCGGDEPGMDCCFLRGTKIRTVQGERAVEDLASGDFLPTEFGGIRPIQWVGRYSVKKKDSSKHWTRHFRPVRVARSGIADGVPHSDLFLTSPHALYLDGALLPVGSLINGTSITHYVADEFDELEFFHIKLATHDVIFAEGAACETLLRVDKRADYCAEYIEKCGFGSLDDRPCAPMLFGTGRSEVKSRIRSAISPWFDRRQKGDIIRDRLEARGLALARHWKRAD
jgi:hypothetical protein